MIKAFAASDAVVSRCGMATLTEISYLGKPSILIPIPKTHQVYNAKIFDENYLPLLGVLFPEEEPFMLPLDYF